MKSRNRHLYDHHVDSGGGENGCAAYQRPYRTRHLLRVKHYTGCCRQLPALRTCGGRLRVISVDLTAALAGRLLSLAPAKAPAGEDFHHGCGDLSPADARYQLCRCVCAGFVTRVHRSSSDTRSSGWPLENHLPWPGLAVLHRNKPLYGSGLS